MARYSLGSLDNIIEGLRRSNMAGWERACLWTAVGILALAEVVSMLLEIMRLVRQ